MRARWLTIFLLGLLAALPAHAQGGDGFGAFDEAANRLDQRIAIASGTASPPRIEDPDVAALFHTLIDRSNLAVDSLGADEAQDVLKSISNRTLGIALVYMNWGISPGTDGGQHELASQRNIVRYQREVTSLWAFLIDTVGGLVRARTEQTRLRAATPLTEPQRQRLNQMRDGTSEFISGFLPLVTLQGVAPEAQLAMVEALARQADTLAGSVTVSQRRRIGIRLESGMPRLGPRGRAIMARVVQAFAATSCTGLCAL